MRIYFAASIRGGRSDQEIYLRIIETLRKYGEVLTEHIGSQALLEQGEVHLSDETIFSRDINLLDECDVIIAEVSNPSLGVGYEIGRMENRKPVLCLFRTQDGRRLSAMLAGNSALRTEKYETLTDVKNILANFLNNLV